MALHQTRTNNVTIGPRMHDEMEGGNPADSLRLGPLPVKLPQADLSHLSRPFDRGEVVALYRGESAPKTTTDWRKEEASDGVGPSPEDYCQPKPCGDDPGASKFGKDANKYSKGDNPEFGIHGGRIYGT